MLSEDGKKPINGNKIALEESVASKVASFKDSHGVVYEVWSQLKTVVASAKSRQHIMPDLRICKQNANVPDNTLVIIECKQRKLMKKKELSTLVEDYSNGAPNSFLNLFVNYDYFPSIPSISSTDILIPKLNPINPSAIDDFYHVIQNRLIDNDIKPSTPRLDAILFDVSGSMQGQYLKKEIGDACEQLIAKNPMAEIFFFNDYLLSTRMLSINNLESKLEGMIRGGTDLDASLKELAKNHPNAKRVAVVTDGGYDRSLTTLGSYESVEQLVIWESFP